MGSAQTTAVSQLPIKVPEDTFPVLSDRRSPVYLDVLTGCANRFSFDEQLDGLLADLSRGVAELSRADLHKVTLLFLDLDRFKVVNDTLGHAVGDALLRTVAERLRSLLSTGALLARLGGDEFAIVLTNTTDEDASTLAARIVELVQRAYLIEGHVVHVGISIGLAIAPDDASTRDQLLKYADLALYHSKAAGRGKFHFFTLAMEQKAQERRKLELDLRRALVLRQFEVRYQPQIDVENGTILAMEGLLRWHHPERGLVLPEDFLPLADEIGISMPIAEWMLKTACKEAARWPRPIKVALNISALHLEASKFARSVENALTASGLPGNRLEIEVTEDILLRDGNPILVTLDQLRKLGVAWPWRALAADWLR